MVIPMSIQIIKILIVSGCHMVKLDGQLNFNNNSRHCLRNISA